jgi:methylase of polypeptide subunit release factors
MTLDGGADGMIYLEHGDGQSDEIEAIAELLGFRVHSKIRDLAGKLRIIVGHRI